MTVTSYDFKSRSSLTLIIIFYRTRGSGRSYDSRDNSTDDDYSDYDSRDDDVSDYRSDDDDDEDHDYVPFKLPTIGYPKTPSLPRSSQSFRSQFSDVPDSLPEVPGSRQLTGMRTAGSQRLMTTQVRSLGDFSCHFQRKGQNRT